MVIAAELGDFPSQVRRTEIWSADIETHSVAAEAAYATLGSVREGQHGGRLRAQHLSRCPRRLVQTVQQVLAQLH